MEIEFYVVVDENENFGVGEILADAADDCGVGAVQRTIRVTMTIPTPRCTEVNITVPEEPHLPVTIGVDNVPKTQT